MDIKTARAIVADHRKRGTHTMTPDEIAIAKEASDFIHDFDMANNPNYSRQFRQAYNSFAVGIGRSDLAGTR